MVLKASMQCPYTQPSMLLKMRPTLLSRRRSGLKIKQGRRQTDGGPRAAWKERCPPPGSNKRRRFNSNDGEEGNTPGTNANGSRYNYYNKETIRVPPSEFNRLVLVDNVAGNVTTSELRQIFGNIGTIEKIYLPVENNQMDGTKRAEILYEKPKHAHTAVKALNHLTLCQQSLKLKLASADSRIDSNFLKAIVFNDEQATGNSDRFLAGNTLINQDETS